MSTYAAVVWLLVLAGTVRGLDKEGFALTLAGECPLFSAWGGALRTEPPLRVSAYALNDELRGAKQDAMPY